jgi:hypothetical protein
MFFLFTPVAVAALVACLRGRSLASLASQRLAWWPLGLAAFGVEAVLTWTPLGEQPWALAWGSSLWLGALAAMLATLGRNAWLRGGAARGAWTIAAVGVGLNLLVVLVNDGHMPQSQAGRLAAGVSTESVAGLSSRAGWRNVAPMTTETRLAWLGDIFPQPSWQPSRNVMSVGDLLLAVGLAGAVYLAMSPRPDEPRRHRTRRERSRIRYSTRHLPPGQTVSTLPHTGSTPSR